MYALCRMMLISAVFSVGYCIAMLAMQFEAQAIYIGFGLIVVACLAKGGYGVLTSHGTARWATKDDLRKGGLLDG